MGLPKVKQPKPNENKHRLSQEVFILRQEIIHPGIAESAAKELYGVLSHRSVVGPTNNCPVAQCVAFVRTCLSQSCGKCVPCRVGLKQLYSILDRILNGEGEESDLATIESVAQVMADSSDCAIGFEAGSALLKGLKAFRADFLSHIHEDRCTAKTEPIPCKAGCPAHVDIPGYIALAKEQRYADAVRVIRYDNPFPAACALVCEHPCEFACRRNMVDDPVNIRGIKRRAVDMAGLVLPPSNMPDTGKKIAVIGGGPSGLTCAYFLQLMGHKVTVFEQRKQLGGMMRYGIPRYRLPAKYLDSDINCILSTGVEAKMEVSVKGEEFEQLKKDFDAVYIAIGAHNANPLGIEGQDAIGVMSAVDILRDMGDNIRPDFTGKRVVIVGGGNVAMDCTRTAMRLGAADVKCVYRRRQVDMTALPEEVEGAIAETCEMVTMMTPVRVEKDEEGRVKALIVQPQIPGAYDRGRPKPVKAERPEERIECDVVIAAIGQKVASKPFEEKGIPTKWGNIQTDKGAFIEPGVYAGGDCASGPETVIRAVEAGKTAAANIDEYLGFRHVLPREVDIPAPAPAPMGPCGRVNQSARRALDCKNDFDIMEKNLTLQECTQECSRCLRCDHHGYGAFRGEERKPW